MLDVLIGQYIAVSGNEVSLSFDTAKSMVAKIKVGVQGDVAILVRAALADLVDAALSCRTAVGGLPTRWSGSVCALAIPVLTSVLWILSVMHCSRQNQSLIHATAQADCISL
ncbi:MAG: hypothetical protein ACI9DC_001776 [Gammaproteobacteria bacterium]